MAALSCLCWGPLTGGTGLHPDLAIAWNGDVVLPSPYESRLGLAGLGARKYMPDQSNLGRFPRRIRWHLRQREEQTEKCDMRLAVGAERPPVLNLLPAEWFGRLSTKLDMLFFMITLNFSDLSLCLL